MKTVQLPSLSLRAAIRPESINLDARTAELVFTTGAPVERFDWMSGSRYLETLSLKRSAVRLDRLNNGAPFLDSHSAYSVDDVLGVVVPGSAKVSGDQAVATVRFSARAAVEPIWGDVRDGILRNVSVGYRVHKYEQTEGEKGAIPIRLAVDWEPYEISAVPMGADDGAKVRADKPETHPCVIVTRLAKEPAMEPTEVIEQPTQTEPTEVPNERDLGAVQERERVQGILAAAFAVRRSAEDPIVKKLLADGVPLVKAQGVLLDTLRRDGKDDEGPKIGSASVRVKTDPLANVWAGITGALLHRVNPELFKLDDNARQYRSRSLLRCAEECLEQRGFRTRDMSKQEIAAMSLGLDVRAGFHTTSDFAIILADVGNKSLRAAYEAAPQTFGPITRRVPIPDFKAVKRDQLGEFPTLAKVLEHGEFTRGTIAEGKEQFSLSTYGRIFAITRQALINDDLNAFGRVATMAGQSARNLESDAAWYQIMKNANMGDAVALFHATHGNLAGSGGAIDVTTLGAGRAALRNQKGLDAVTFLNLTARYLIVPPGKETLADQYTTQITPAQGSNVNPFSGRLTVISEPRLEGGVTFDGDTVAGSAIIWYLAASLDQTIDMLELGFLDGENGPVVESRVGFDVDGVEFKCRHDVGAKAIDFRGLYKNPGA